LILLLAVSLPLLALVRVFGGVPWDYVVLGLCVTLTTALFVGSLSLLLSIRGGQFQRVVTSVLGWCLLLWGGGAAAFLSLSQAGYLSPARVASILFLSNPFVLMLAETRGMLGASGGPAGLAWALHCAVALAAAGLMLLLAIWRVRKITIMSIVAQVESRHGGAGGRAPARSSARLWPWRRATKPITGSPIVWKERHRPWFRGGRRSVVYASIALVLAIAALIALLMVGGRSFVVFLLPIQALQLAFIVAVATAAASAITREKEARTWPILLATPLTNREIARGKASGILRRCLWLLTPVPLLYLLFGSLAPLGNTNLVWVMLSVAGIVLGLASAAVFLLGLGLYLSARLRTTTAAVAATLGVYFGSRIFCCGFPLSLWSALMVRPGGAGIHSVPLMSLLMSIGPAIVRVGLGVLFLRLTTQRLRRNVFA
jgi:ABC-type transport system involved in multi-copper enzyme maturation permease subunit